MPSTPDSTRIAPYIQELLDNEYARDNLREAATRLQDAYERSRKRRVKATRDEKLRRQLGIAAASIVEGGRALSDGRRKPVRRGRRRLAGLALGVGIGAGIAMASNPELREALFGSDAASPEGEGR